MDRQLTALERIVLTMALRGSIVSVLTVTGEVMARGLTTDGGQYVPLFVVDSLEHLGLLSGTVLDYQGEQMPEWTITALGQFAMSSRPVRDFATVNLNG